jgi:1,4-dihydroxy-2-naphthoate octaprenyltransferase
MFNLSLGEKIGGFLWGVLAVVLAYFLTDGNLGPWVLLSFVLIGVFTIISAIDQWEK